MADIIQLKTLGDKPGPRFLIGLVRGDHGVVLTNNFNDDATRWRREVSASGKTWTLECLGSPPPGVDPGRLFLFGTTGGPLIDTISNGGPFTWRARPVAGVVGEVVTLENKGLRDGGIDNRFLDGRTDAGDVSLAPNVDPPFTGTHWQVLLTL